MCRKERKEATANWMEVYEESEGGMEMFNVAKEYLMAKLRKQGFDTYTILRQSGEGTYTVGSDPGFPVLEWQRARCLGLQIPRPEPRPPFRTTLLSSYWRKSSVSRSSTRLRSKSSTRLPRNTPAGTVGFRRHSSQNLFIF